MKSMAVAPKSHKYVKKLAVGAEDLNEKESTVYQCEARSHEAPKEENSQEFLLLNQPREPSILPYTPVTLEQQPRVSLSWEPPGTSARPKRFSSVILQPRATSGPLLLQPQVPNASNQDSVSAALEWQRKLEAAEALLALKNSFQAPSDSVCLQQPGGLPGPAGERGLQIPGPCLLPRPTSSVALPTGHLECISFLT